MGNPRQSLANVGEIHFTGLGESNLPMSTHEQARAQKALEVCNLPAHRARRHAQLLCGPSKAQMACGSVKGTYSIQGRQMHGSHLG